MKQPTDPVTKAMRTKFNRKIYGALRTEGNNKKISLTEGQMNQIGILIEPIIKKALTSLAQEKDKEIEQLSSLYDNVKTQCDAFRNKCEQLKADEIQFLESIIGTPTIRVGISSERRIKERLAQLRGRQ